MKRPYILLAMQPFVGYQHCHRLGPKESMGIFVKSGRSFAHFVSSVGDQKPNVNWYSRCFTGCFGVWFQKRRSSLASSLFKLQKKQPVNDRFEFGFWLSSDKMKLLSISFLKKKMVCILISFAPFFWHWYAFKSFWSQPTLEWFPWTCTHTYKLALTFIYIYCCLALRLFIFHTCSFYFALFW